MDTIKIPKEKVLELLNKSECKFTDCDTYSDYTFELVDSYKEGTDSFVYITFKDLASLLYDRNCSFDYVNVIVV